MNLVFLNAKQLLIVVMLLHVKSVIILLTLTLSLLAHIPAPHL